MKIPDAYLQMVSNTCTSFQKNPCAHFLQHAWNKSCPQTVERQTDNRLTDKQTDNVKAIYPPPKFRLRGYNNV